VIARKTRWRADPEDVKRLGFLNGHAQEAGVLKVDWSFND
jgi:hypothetical protein